jgi:HAD superfamily hydrolase (TIGR01490 family)
VKRSIAFFDFDGTISAKDSLIELIRYQKGSFRLYTGLLINGPRLLAFRLGLVSNHAAKQMILRYFFGGMVLSRFRQECEAFSRGVLGQWIRPKAIKEIRMLQEKGTEVVIVSASATEWLKAWADGMGVGLIATLLESRNERITGKILGKNCHGIEKVRRIREAYDLSDYSEVYAYGDSHGDKPMMALANHPFYRPFR